MALTGRLAGVSGILGGLLQARPADRAGGSRSSRDSIAAPLVAALAGAPLPGPAMTSSLALVAAGGLLVGFGSRLGNGCTSGPWRVRLRAAFGAPRLRRPSSSWRAPSLRLPSSATVLRIDAMPAVLVQLCLRLISSAPASLISRHDGARKSARLPRHFWRVGRNAGLRDGRRRSPSPRSALRWRGGAALRCSRQNFSGRSAATSMRRWSRARCCSASAGAWSASVPGRRWSTSRDSACRLSSLSSRCCLGMIGL